MVEYIIGSARSDENGKLRGGQAGDQKQKSNTDDRVGEVSMQKFYLHSKGWYVFRAKSAEIAHKLAYAMRVACNNPLIGYDQAQREGIWTYGTNTKTKTECDCSSLVRQCIKEASGVDVGNFTTAIEPSMLAKSGLFEDKKTYATGMALYEGDILVTKTSGHTVIVVEGYTRSGRPQVAKPTLKYGAKGEQVKLLQQDLNYFGAGLEVDGSFGQKTETALKNWQKLNTDVNGNKLAVDGSYGSKSYNAMLKLLS